MHFRYNDKGIVCTDDWRIVGEVYDDWTEELRMEVAWDAEIRENGGITSKDSLKKRNTTVTRKINVSRDRTLRSVAELALQKSQADADLLAHQEMLIWAVLYNRFELAEFFWEEGGHAIPNALIASRLFRAMATNEILTKRGGLEARLTKMDEFADMFETFAIGVVDMCYVKNADQTQDVLEAKLSPFDWMVLSDQKSFPDSLDIAFLAGNRNFLNHSSCQAVFKRLWRGGRTHWEKRTAEGYLINKGFTLKRFKRMALAPRVKFGLEFASFCLLLVFNSYFALTELDDSSISSTEGLLAMWFFVLVCEELRQIFDDGWDRIYLWRWWDDMYNRIDLTVYALFFATFTIRVDAVRDGGTQEESSLRACNALYGLNLFLLYIRVMSYLKAWAWIGPKITIFGELFAILTSYIVLLFVFIVGFGIFMQTVLNPHESFRDDPGLTVSMVLMRPYYQIYGELMLEELVEETRCIGHEPFTGCGSWFESVLIPVTFGMYMIVTSVMILNMLIADFSSTFDRIKAESDQIWRMNLFELKSQFDSKPALPVPLSAPLLALRLASNLPTILSLIITRGKFQDAWALWFNSSVNLQLLRIMDIKYEKAEMGADQATAVEEFQDEICDRYLDQRRKKKKFGADERLLRIEDKLDVTERELMNLKAMSSASHLGEYAGGRFSRGALTVRFRPPDYRYGEAGAIPGKVSELVANAIIDPETGAVENFWALEDKRDSTGGRCWCRFMTIFTRWKRDAQGIRVARGGRPLLEFVGVKHRQDDQHWAIPELREDAAELNLKKPYNLDAEGNPIDDRAKIDHFEALADEGPHGRTMLYFPSHRTSPVYEFAFHKKNFRSEVTETQQTGVDKDLKEMLDCMQKPPDVVSPTMSPHSPEHKRRRLEILQEISRAREKNDNMPIPLEHGIAELQGRIVCQGLLSIRDPKEDEPVQNTVQRVIVQIFHDADDLTQAYELVSSMGEFDRDGDTKAGYAGNSDVDYPPAEVAWLTMHRDLNLCGDQEDLIYHVAKLCDAHWG